VKAAGAELMNLKIHQHPVRDCGREVQASLKRESQHEMGVKTDFWIVRENDPVGCDLTNLACFSNETEDRQVSVTGKSLWQVKPV
jgi:hypothetical protein